MATYATWGWLLLKRARGLAHGRWQRYQGGQWCLGFFMGVFILLGAEGAALLGASGGGLIIQVPAAALDKPVTAAIQHAARQALPGVEARLEAKLPPTLDTAMGPVLNSFSVHVDGISVPLPSVVRNDLAAKMNTLVQHTVAEYARQNLRPSEVITPALAQMLWRALLTQVHELRVSIPLTLPLVGRITVPVVLEVQPGQR